MSKKLGLYIHIPFCRRKCFYCDFISITYQEQLSQKYIKALLKEAQNYKNSAVNTIYIGGGTPSTLTAKQLEELIVNIKSNFDISNVEEFTIELNPESTTKEKLQILFQLGVTRLSFGLQSTKDNQLVILGRLHSYNKFFETYNLAKEVGFYNINIDLMYGIPKQTFEDFKNILKDVIKLDSSHISLYPLTIEQNTVFYNQHIQTDSELQRKMYDMSCLVLQENNFCHYEISNWAKDNKFSKHNKLYWQNQEYIGLGASASSYYKRYRYKNDTNVVKYIENIFNKQNVIIEKEYITNELYDKETIMLGLRLYEGVDIKYFDNKKEILNNFVNNNLLKIKNNKVLLTQQGLFVSNSIISEFI